MKTLFIAASAFFVYYQSTPTAIEQVKTLKKPVIVVSRYGGATYNNNVYMTVQDGDGNYVSLHKDSTLMYLVNKYRANDTIK